LKRNIHKLFSVFCFLTVFFLLPGIPEAQTPKKILILPFQIHSGKDLSFLKKGIADMLSSRLALQDQTVLISPAEAMRSGTEPASAPEALALGAKAGADYVVFGSLTVFGDSISTDARLIDVNQKKPVVVFNQFGKRQEDAIAHVDQFAAKIYEQVFGRTTVSAPPPAPKKEADWSRRHPEAVFKESGGLSSEYTSEAPGQVTRRDFTIWRSRNFDMHITSMSVGDVDGDGRNEAVFISEDVLQVYRFASEHFQKVAEISRDSNSAFVTVDVADINKNGRAEIFVTALNAKGDPTDSNPRRNLRSFVLEWSGSEFVKVVTDQSWYYRVIRVPKSGPLLLGQRRGFERVFSGGVYLMVWQNGGYEPTQRQKLPRGANVFSFTFGDVANDGQEMIVAFTGQDYLEVVSREGDQRWASSSSMGGSGIYLEYYDPGDSAQGSALAGVPEMEYYYIAQRIHVVDMEGDGKNEVVVVNNRETMGKSLSRFRSYKSGHIECLSWDALGLHPKWKTREVSGYISDYAVADFDNDGSLELVFAVDPDMNPFANAKAKSYLVSWKPLRKAKSEK